MEGVLKNAWYMAGWSEELGDARLTRRIAGIPILLFRDDNGAAIALEDRCPHRFAPLSLGKINGDTVTCPYHGLQFSHTGACIRNPFSDRIPAAARVRSFRVEERDTILWLWLGDPETADTALIADFSFLQETAELHSIRGYTLMKANFEYGTDNLLDLSHIEFVHRGTFAGEGVIFAGKHEIVQDGLTLHSNWWIPNIPPPSMAKDVYPPESRVDHWLDMRWNAPAAMKLQAGATLTGNTREQGFNSEQAHIVTPLDKDNSHYFWAVSRCHDLDSAEVDAIFLKLFAEAFDEEDKPIIEASYRNTDGVDFWDRKPLSLGIDAGGARARRMLQQMIREESAALPKS